jgi:hypothetical protein
MYIVSLALQVRYISPVWQHEEASDTHPYKAESEAKDTEWASIL